MEHNARRILFGRYPRTVASKTEDGKLRQSFVHSDSEIDLFVDTMEDRRDLYSSICKFDSNMTPIMGDVAFDFDSEMKDTYWSENIPEKQKIAEMRNDKNVADNVLGPVWDDAQSLVERCVEENIPTISIFSGMGVHVHLLYQIEREPKEKKISTTQRFVEECGLDTWDRKILTDLRRVLRIPNSKRFDNGEFTEVYNIPITEKEVLNNSLHDLLERSSQPKSIEYHDRYKEDNRPEMKVHEGYEDIDYQDVQVEIEDNPTEFSTNGWIEWVIDECIPLPCLSERFKSYNPHHYVRLAGAIHLFNAGFSPGEVIDIIESLGWRDYKREKTRDYVKQIYSKGYSDPKCETLMKKGLCVHQPGFDGYSDEPEDCETHKWRNGKCEW